MAAILQRFVLFRSSCFYKKTFGNIFCDTYKLDRFIAATACYITDTLNNMPPKRKAPTATVEKDIGKQSNGTERPRRTPRHAEKSEQVGDDNIPEKKPKKVKAAQDKPKKEKAAPEKPKKEQDAPEKPKKEKAVPEKPKKEQDAPEKTKKEQDAPEKPKKKPAAKVDKKETAEKEKKPAAPKAARSNKKAKENETDKPEPKEKALTNQTETDYSGIDFTCTKVNALGEKYNLKISTWNVDGLRAWLKKGGLEFLSQENPDILCLQETKCSEGKLPDEIKCVEGYQAYWCNGDKEGYAGVAVFSKKKPLSVVYGINEVEHDDEGRCITLEFDKFYLVNTYVPNAGRKLVTLPKRLNWNELFKSYIKELDQKKPVILCGDMNVAHNEIDLANPKTNTKNAGFTVEEREGMTDFLADGYVDTFRKLYPDKTEAYTFWSYITKARVKNVGWRLDYFIVSDRIMDNVCDNVIRSEVYGSDHCPVTVFINI